MSNQIGQPDQSGGFELAEAPDGVEYVGSPALGDTMSFGRKVLIVAAAVGFGVSMELLQRYTGVNIDQYLP
jgi:hypothetical protein